MSEVLRHHAASDETDLMKTMKVAKCPRFGGQERMTVAVRNIKRGEQFFSMGWLSSASFVSGLSNNKDASNYTPEEKDLLKGGTPIDEEFSSFPSPGYLQLMMDLIEKHGDLCKLWVESNAFVVRITNTTLESLTKEWQKRCILYLKNVRHMPNESLLFWLNSVNFLQFYSVVCTNSFLIDFLLSGTVVGVGFCPVLACINHDCIPNTFIEKIPSGYKLIAAVDIKEGEEICVSYHNQAVGLLTDDELNQMLMHRFGFECHCPMHLGKKPIYLKSVVQPASLQVVCRKTKGLAEFLDQLNDEFRAQHYEQVRALCYKIERKYVT